jgi:hypothetical protein
MNIDLFVFVVLISILIFALVSPVIAFLSVLL